MFQKEKEEWGRQFVSSGYMDAYTVDPYFLAPENIDSSLNTNWLVLFESAAEYPWGVRAYTLLSKGAKLVFIGDIPLMVDDGSDSNGASLLPHLHIVQDDRFEIMFDASTVLLNEDGMPENYPAGSVKYIEKDGKLVMERMNTK
ncbi:hypothetical protein [Photobacterium nomapromontoriensis]|uniref:hypothetical protein n=1 Tax=Photobacterium nomapromontoriensis TaxID=2910237 RepID=UPI003D106655